ncbi:glycine-rich protein HC1-like [Solanum verrucosum]|uniref:glycine-rich protein HC1-like n=1 Tax=Solanum verrucosum TaxID=315347 RepID=UPI0020CFED04|nr:glycine-rich protein HC1-like [Solanum verrucosum]
MGSKAFFVSWHFLVIFAIISSEVVARELAETSMKSDVVYENGYNDIDGYSRDEHDAYNNGYKYFGGGYYPPRGGNNFSGSEYKPPHDDYNNRYKSLGGAYNNGYNPSKWRIHPPT